MLQKLGKKGNLGPFKSMAMSIVVIVVLIAFGLLFLAEFQATDTVVADTAVDNAIDTGVTELTNLLGWVGLAILAVVFGFLIGYIVKKLSV